MAVFDGLRTKYEATALMQAVSSHLNDGSDKVKISLFEFALPLIPLSAAYLNSHIRSFVSRIAAVLQSTNTPATLHKAAIAVLAALVRFSPATFAIQLKPMPLEVQSLIKRTLKKHCPDVQAELNSVARANDGNGGCSNGRAASARGKTNLKIDTAEAATVPLRQQVHDQCPSPRRIGALVEAIDMRQPPSIRTDAIHQLVQLVHEGQVQPGDFNPILFVLLEGLCQHLSQQGAVVPASLDLAVLASHHAALLALKAMLQHHGNRFSDYLDMITTRLLACCIVFPYDLAQATEVVLASLLRTLDPVACLNSLEPWILPHKDTRLSGIRVLKKLVSRLPSAHLLNALPQLLPSLVDALSGEAVETRKAAVLALVEIYLVVGDSLMPYLAPTLTTAQLKLVTIYISRRAGGKTACG